MEQDRSLWHVAGFPFQAVEMTASTMAKMF